MRKTLLSTLVLLATTLSASAVEVCKSTMLYAVKGADSLYMDRYTASRQSPEKRPCMIFLFGGGFTHGDRDAEKYRSFFNNMAASGMDVVSIDYRLGLSDATPADLSSPELFARKLICAIRMAVDDLYSATSHVLRNAEAWGVDTDRIVSCGSSAGAITVLQGEYALCNEAPNAKMLPEGFRYAGVISFAGAIFCLGDELVWAKKPSPLLLFHGTADSNVPYGVVRVPGAGFFGSEYIANELYDRIHSPFVFYSVEGAAHEMAEIPMNDNLGEIESFLNNMVYDRQPLMIRTDVTTIGRTVSNREFTIEDYIRANFAGN